MPAGAGIPEHGGEAMDAKIDTLTPAKGVAR
jgi:hypothetical protein